MRDIIKILILDDEPIWQKSLKLNLTELGYDVVAIANNSDEALVLLASQDFDIALLDITINGENSGIELGRIISTVYNKPFIFITGSQNNHTIEETAIACPSSYLIKPANKTSLLVAIQNSINNHQYKKIANFEKTDDTHDYLFVKTGTKYKKINWADVILMTSEGNYTKLLCSKDSQEHFIRSTLPQTFKNYLPQPYKDKFVQINRSEMINIDFIEEINGIAIFTKYQQFHCSENQLKELKKRLKILS